MLYTGGPGDYDDSFQGDSGGLMFDRESTMVGGMRRRVCPRQLFRSLLACFQHQGLDRCDDA
jgi:hypothetical protein